MKWIEIECDGKRYRGRWMDGLSPWLRDWAERQGAWPAIRRATDKLRESHEVDAPLVTSRLRVTIREEVPCGT